MEVEPRKKILVANWKCGGSVQTIRDHVNNTLNKIEFSQDKLQVIVAPTSIHIASVKALLRDHIKVSAQNMSTVANGSKTGEVSGEQLVDFDVRWVILGHSERRNMFGETNEVIA
mmetsp:Transcript_11025/g.16736  ORF Transcript_11025/g.16736 Transcript_11025/m.16736 type:complete len:115 (-) Transcript_11025:443-787(-)